VGPLPLDLRTGEVAMTAVDEKRKSKTENRRLSISDFRVSLPGLLIATVSLCETHS
jgi:hypothetical protein